jgi:hypothetical protein
MLLPGILKRVFGSIVGGLLLVSPLLAAEPGSLNTVAQVAGKLDLKKSLTVNAELKTNTQAVATEYRSRLVLNEFEVSMNEVTSTVSANKRWIVSGTKKGIFTAKELDRLVKSLQKESPGQAGTVTISFDQSN